jgi:hypothetical protein
VNAWWNIFEGPTACTRSSPVVAGGSAAAAAAATGEGAGQHEHEEDVTREAGADDTHIFSQRPSTPPPVRSEERKCPGAPRKKRRVYAPLVVGLD